MLGQVSRFDFKAQEGIIKGSNGSLLHLKFATTWLIT
jgi:hypothetical protein